MEKMIELKCSRIEFTRFSIKYYFENSIINEGDYMWFCMPDIVEKDLIPKNNIVSKDQNFLCFTPSNVTPEFYQSIFDKTIRNVSEYELERNHIYKEGDVVGFAFKIS